MCMCACALACVLYYMYISWSSDYKLCEIIMLVGSENYKIESTHSDTKDYLALWVRWHGWVLCCCWWVFSWLILAPLLPSVASLSLWHVMITYYETHHRTHVLPMHLSTIDLENEHGEYYYTVVVLSVRLCVCTSGRSLEASRLQHKKLSSSTTLKSDTTSLCWLTQPATPLAPHWTKCFRSVWD